MKTAQSVSLCFAVKQLSSVPHFLVYFMISKLFPEQTSTGINVLLCGGCFMHVPESEQPVGPFQHLLSGAESPGGRGSTPGLLKALLSSSRCPATTDRRRLTVKDVKHFSTKQ